MRGIQRLLGAALALLTATAVVGQAPPGRDAAASTRYRIRTQDVAPGLKLHRIRDARGPKAIRVLEMAPGTELALDVALARDRIPWLERTSSIASRRGALAAINGDYTIGVNHEWVGRPVHAFAHDARMVATELAWGRNVGIDESKRIAALGRPRMSGALTHPRTGKSWRVHRWNDLLYGTGIAAYTPEGGRAFKPPRDACSIRLFPQGGPFWSSDGLGIEQEHLVDEVACRTKRLGRRGGTVVATPRASSKGAQFESNVVAGDLVSLTWSLGWPGVVETLGGNPTLIEGGVLVAQCEGSSFCKRHPRTGVGTRPDGTILLVTVDGRRKNSVGIKPMAFAKLFRWLGADWALNLDGGGSTTMWVQGRIVNIPSNDGQERPVGSALLVLPQRDPNEPRVGPVQQGDSGSSSDPAPDLDIFGIFGRVAAAPAEPTLRTGAQTTCRILADPASTGGLFDALARGSFVGGPGGKGGVPVDLPDRLREALDVFRGRTSCAAYLDGGGR